MTEAEQGLTFDGLRGFIEHIRTNIYLDQSFTERLGLTESEAQMIVAAYGVLWDVVGDDGLGKFDDVDWESGAVNWWWFDLEHSTTFIPGYDVADTWSHFAFDVYYGEFSAHNNFAVSPQLMFLMFRPGDWHNWLISHYPSLAHHVGMFASSPDTWYDPFYWNPDNPQISFPEMGYFDSGFIDRIIKINRLTLLHYIVGVSSGQDMLSMLQYLYSQEWYNSS